MHNGDDNDYERGEANGRAIGNRDAEDAEGSADAVGELRRTAFWLTGRRQGQEREETQGKLAEHRPTANRQHVRFVLNLAGCAN